uniref:Uncharacterized protein n=1 Tax=Opuntia streptacantha TaxID=393608 RepID=A0A7C9CFU9_OPUST
MVQVPVLASFPHCSITGGRRRASLLLYLAIRCNLSSLNLARTLLALLICLFNSSFVLKSSILFSSSLISVSLSFSFLFSREDSDIGIGDGFGRDFIKSPYCS